MPTSIANTCGVRALRRCVEIELALLKVGSFKNNLLIGIVYLSVKLNKEYVPSHPCWSSRC